MGRHTVIYIFGLGDHRSRGQTLAVQLWRLRGVGVRVHHMHWNQAGTLDAKLAPLIENIDALHAAGRRVSLVGVSAGASAAIHAYARRPQIVHRVVCLCGKLRHAETVHPRVYHTNPAFQQSMEALPASLDALGKIGRERILSVRPMADNSVPPADTDVPDAHTARVPTRGHVLSIAYCITIYSRRIVRYIRQ